MDFCCETCTRKKVAFGYPILKVVQVLFDVKMMLKLSSIWVFPKIGVSQKDGL